ncbi:hypothetical protein GCM10022254_50000 [Actinomadura meridiana]|uniref:Uncharacterized protein n=1 Tax=Actinomadura meridiana TaxID=559626 RepID=A0ABP8CCF4_9ACTN
MSGKKISPVFIIFCAVGLLIIAFALFATFVAGSKVDDPDENKGEIQLQLASMLNFILIGMSLILVGLGFQHASGPNTTPAALPGQTPGYQYGQPAQQQYQYQVPQQQHQTPQHQAQQPGQQWGQQPPGAPPAQ